MGNNDTQSESIKDTVIKIVIDCLKLKDEQQATLSGSTNLAKDLNLDSLDFVDLVMCLEDHFSIEISDEEAQELETIDKIEEYIRNKLSDKTN
ncbi:acyl carrier protein [Ehrlichia ruminantium]|uniref:Acyl carrier protein n=2 Tax=Ehrlichia ruminantium TaxID=779 RepID=A0A161LWE8_EHRRU|nr:acyl carrier protein [Ehrlichia ruminantium]KYW90977.1 acyl carrier protein [Ehrlichia ruminantium]QLK50294.1 acyl carrier protein [Ehrlichia ruminantium]QLK51218.1 acyl carrier protein [Ehrlichia ruminantium]QLK52143.1 acyl carrier protein [Ehrlichia ruminantium]QLK53053.1 acyl carrier protein [Ehrlichia ruminantium]